MSIRVWGRANSSNVAKVMWAIAEIGLPHERIDIGGPFGGTDSPEYRALNPNGQIPTIEDGELVLWESNAIVRYVASTYDVGRHLWPEDRHARADADRWMDWASLTLAPSIDAMRKAYRATVPDRAMVDRAVAMAAERWRVLEPRLVEHSYVAGDRLTVADIGLGALVHRWHLAPVDRPALPGTSAWYERLSRRPAYAEHVASKVA